MRTLKDDVSTGARHPCNSFNTESASLQSPERKVTPLSAAATYEQASLLIADLQYRPRTTRGSVFRLFSNKQTYAAGWQRNQAGN